MANSTACLLIRMRPAMPPSDDDIKRIAREGAKGADFVIRFANLAVKLKRAKVARNGVVLSAPEVKTLIEALGYLRDGIEKKP